MHISNDTIHIAVAETSVILRCGVITALERIAFLKAHLIELPTMEELENCMEMHSPDILIVNPLFCGKFQLKRMRESYPSVRYIALISSFVDGQALSEYDAVISINDDLSRLCDIFNPSSDAERGGLSGGAEGVREGEDSGDVLSQREKEIVVCVVRGLTNKEIADELFLSVHTVITHRRNISRKLQIHSAAGLTIYAIANKLIDLKDLK